MKNKPPTAVAENVKQLVYDEADRSNYLAKSREENGVFMDYLVSHRDIGGVLAEFMKKEEIRTYIKDAILNRYSKDKAKTAKPKNLAGIIKKTYSLAANDIDEDRKSGVVLFKSTDIRRDNEYIVVANGTALKWETALRKALLYLPGKPFSQNPNNTVHILLTLFAQHKKITSAEKKLLEEALRICNATVYVYGEA